MRRSPLVRAYKAIPLTDHWVYICDGPPPHPLDAAISSYSIRRATGYTCQMRIKDGIPGWYAAGPRMVEEIADEIHHRYPKLHATINWDNLDEWDAS